MAADVRFYQVMMSFCKRHLPGKAPDVLDAAVKRGCHVCDALFCTFIAACQRAKRPLMRQVLERYATCGPRSHNVIFGVANICRHARRPASALSLVSDAIDNNVEISEEMLSLFAVCCAEARRPVGADTAERLLGYIRSKRIAPHKQVQLYANLVKALLSQNRVASALRALDLMESIGVQPSMQISTLILSALAKTGRVFQAIALFESMVKRDLRVDNPVFCLLVGACGRSANQSSVHKLWQYARDKQLLDDDFVVCALISACDRCGDLESARQVFLDRCANSKPDQATLRAMVMTYTRHGLLQDAVESFDKYKPSEAEPAREVCSMLVMALLRDGCVSGALSVFNSTFGGGVEADPDVLVPIVDACGRTAELGTLQSLRRFANDHGLMTDDAVVRAFIVAYGKCGLIDTAKQIFDAGESSTPSNTVFDAMIGAYCRCGMASQELSAFEQMTACDTQPSADTFASILPVLAEENRIADAMKLFDTMLTQGIVLGAHVFTLLVSAVGRSSELPALQTLHQYALDHNHALLRDDGVIRSLVAAFARCGDIETSAQVFESHCKEVSTTSIAVYNAMLAAFADWGMLSNAMVAYERLKSSRMLPTEATLGALLAACSHVGDLSQANAVLSEFARDYQVAVSPGGAVFMVDLHGRVGNLEQAERIAASHSQGQIGHWLTLLRACWHHSDVARAERVFARILSFGNAEPEALAPAYALMLNMFSGCGRDEDAARLRSEMGMRSVPTVIEQADLRLVDGRMSFQPSDVLYESVPDFRAQHDELLGRLVKAGYKVNQSSPDHVMHGEMLAIAYALKVAPVGQAVRVEKSSPICRDCHDGAKRTSALFERDIYIRDPIRQHHFHNGRCSCRDYW
ncbi:hypothetical protein PBRA_001489 [Plasmodiophora brassicae]|uniref:DYW domain-containing protein n=1 Tax=Plasmodiophora brassicae TaxID=37360 RepID=A0A0G4IYL7_PLABS|nr:hypothetical protein PBRA_001489 [Plasmodiophora brassicae]